MVAVLAVASAVPVNIAENIPKPQEKVQAAADDLETAASAYAWVHYIALRIFEFIFVIFVTNKINEIEKKSTQTHALRISVFIDFFFFIN